MLLKALTTDLMCEIPLILYVQTPAVDDIMAIRVCLCFLMADFFFFSNFKPARSPSTKLL